MCWRRPTTIGRRAARSLAVSTALSCLARPPPSVGTHFISPRCFSLSRLASSWATRSEVLAHIVMAAKSSSARRVEGKGTGRRGGLVPLRSLRQAKPVEAALARLVPFFKEHLGKLKAEKHAA